MQRGLSEGRQAETGAGRDARCGLTTQQVSGWFGDFQVTRPEGGAPWYQATDAGSSRGQLKYTNSGRDVKTEKLNVCERRGSEICYAVCLWRDALCRVVGALCVAHPLDAFDALTSLNMEKSLHQPVGSQEAEDSARITNLLGHLGNEKTQADNWLSVYLM